jgi:hypothetical protein
MNNTKRRRFLGMALAFGGLCFGRYSIAQVSGINDAINKSGRQRMLSQRMAKAYLQIGQAIDAERSKKILDASSSLFEKQLGELKTFAPTPDNKATLAELEKAWSAYKNVLTGRPPNRNDAKAVIAMSDEVLALANTATLQLERYSGTVGGRLINMAGRQRMLSQRMAKFYQAIGWEVAAQDAWTKLSDARREFVAALSELSGSPKTTAAIKRELELAEQQWIFFENALNSTAGQTGNKAQLATNVATTSERILETMDHITTLYEALT